MSKSYSSPNAGTGEHHTDIQISIPAQGMRKLHGRTPISVGLGWMSRTVMKRNEQRAPEVGKAIPALCNLDESLQVLENSAWEGRG